jgi:hypothetical protein
MAHFLIVAVAVAFLAPDDRARTIINSYAFSKQYTVTITDEALKQAPSWKDDAENPPLSARKAIKLADDTKDSLVKDSKDYKWVLRSASLELVPDSGGKWFWLVNYEAEFQRGGSGVPFGLRLAVLMDGKVVKPEVKEYP